jgi:hypothetical protein
MTTEQKIIRAKVGLLEVARQLGNVSQAGRLVNPSSHRPVASSRFCPGSARGRHLMGSD